MLNISKKDIGPKEYESMQSSRLLTTPEKLHVIRRWLRGSIVGLLLMLFLPWQQNIQGYGKVTPFRPQDRPQAVQSVIAGRIERWAVREGQYVNKGDTLVVISEIKEKFFDPQILARTDEQIKQKMDAVGSKEQKVGALQNQISALQSGLRFKLAQAKNKVQQSRYKVEVEKAELEAARVNARLATDQYDRLEKLYKQGLESLTNLQNRSNKNQEAQAKLIAAENKYNLAQNELRNAEIELNSVEAEYLDKISKAESILSETAADIFESQADINKMRIEYSNLMVRTGLYVIRAPQDGYIVRASRAGLGETIREGEEVITIVPTHSQLAVEIFVKPMDLPLLYEGCPVRVQFDGWPALVFSGWPNVSVGTFGGRVSAIDRVISVNGKYRILVTPDPNEDPWPELIRAGSGVYGWAMLNNVLLGYEMWRLFNGFPPEMTKEVSEMYIDDSKKDKKADSKEE
ncbi:MAG: HlyD family secretion protein [Bacteroidota bacterium]|jgi:multidrug resistance efflux pump